MKKLILALLIFLNTSLAGATGLIYDGDIFTCDGSTCTPKYNMLLNGAGSAGITIGGSPIAGGTSGYLLYNNAGILGNLNPSSLSITWGQITGTPTTIAGYGLTDAANVTLNNVTGTLPINHGGTGQTTASTALNALLPSQGGNSGLFLTTNGTNPTWAPATYTPPARYSSGGTALSSGNFSLTAGGGGTWGAGSSVGSISGNDSGFTATVTTAGSPGANPILTLTFADGAWPSVPFGTCGSWVTGTTLSADIATSTTTTLALQFIGTPTTGTAYTITCSWVHG